MNDIQLSKGCGKQPLSQAQGHKYRRPRTDQFYDSITSLLEWLVTTSSQRNANIDVQWTQFPNLSV